MSVVPMLAVHDCSAALDFYRTAFGASEQGERYEWEGKIGHAEMEVLGARVMLADEFPEFNRSARTLGGTPVMLHVDVDDVDGVAKRFEAAGGAIKRPPTDQPFGRVCTLEDPFGHVWFLNGPLTG
jgi:PhnB protein